MSLPTAGPSAPILPIAPIRTRTGPTSVCARGPPMPSEIDRQGSRHVLLAAATAAVDAQSQHDGQHPPGQSGALKRVLMFPDSPRRPRPGKCMCRCTCKTLTAPAAQEHHSQETAGLDLVQRQSCVARDTPGNAAGPRSPPRAGSCGRGSPALACAPTGPEPTHRPQKARPPQPTARSLKTLIPRANFAEPLFPGVVVAGQDRAACRLPRSRTTPRQRSGREIGPPYAPCGPRWRKLTPPSRWPPRSQDQEHGLGGSHRRETPSPGAGSHTIPAGHGGRAGHVRRDGLARGATSAPSRITAADHVLTTAFAAQPPFPPSASTAITSSRSGPVMSPSLTWATRPPARIS